MWQLVKFDKILVVFTKILIHTIRRIVYRLIGQERTSFEERQFQVSPRLSVIVSTENAIFSQNFTFKAVSRNERTKYW